MAKIYVASSWRNQYYNDVVKKLRLARRGQRVVVTGGAPFGTTPYTNFMLIHKVS